MMKDSYSNTMIKVLLFAYCSLLITSSAFAYNPSQGDTNRVDSKNMKQGFWEEKADNITWYGNYLNNKKEGNWVTYDQGGILRELITYKDGMKNGISIAIEKNGYLSKEEYYSNDLLNGSAKTYSQGGRLKSEINYKMGVLNGSRKLYYADGKIQEESI